MELGAWSSEPERKLGPPLAFRTPPSAFRIFPALAARRSTLDSSAEAIVPEAAAKCERNFWPGGGEFFFVKIPRRNVWPGYFVCDSQFVISSIARRPLASNESPLGSGHVDDGSGAAADFLCWPQYRPHNLRNDTSPNKWWCFQAGGIRQKPDVSMGSDNLNTCTEPLHKTPMPRVN